MDKTGKPIYFFKKHPGKQEKMFMFYQKSTTDFF